MKLWFTLYIRTLMAEKKVVNNCKGLLCLGRSILCCKFISSCINISSYQILRINMRILLHLLEYLSLLLRKFRTLHSLSTAWAKLLWPIPVEQGWILLQTSFTCIVCMAKMFSHLGKCLIKFSLHSCWKSWNEITWH